MKEKLPHGSSFHVMLDDCLEAQSPELVDETELFSTVEFELIAGPDVEELKQEMICIIDQSFFSQGELEGQFDGVQVSRYPGQDDGIQRRLGLYVLDVLLPCRDKSLIAFLEARLFRSKSVRPKNNPTPAQRLLALCALISREGGLVEEARSISQRLSGRNYFSLDDQIARALAAKHSSESKSDDSDLMDRDDRIARKAAALLSQGKRKHELASILAPQFELSTKSIRRILKKADIT